MTPRTLIGFLLLAGLSAAAAGQTEPPVAQPARPGVLDRTGSTAHAPTVLVQREGCVTAECHPGVKEHPVLHGPVRVNGCDGCHSLTDAATHKFKAVRERHELCGLCHNPDEHLGAFSHEPFAKGECLACHDPHGSKEGKLLRGEKYVDSCLSCHKDMTGARDRVHGPASAGACGACHQPHTSRLPKLLNAEGRDLCLRCHIKTDLEIENKPVVHAPVLGDCGVCHDPHATDNPGMLRSDAATLCTECHQDVAHTMAEATNPHAAVTTKRACLNCHNPHASSNVALLKSDVKSLCFECHNQPIAMKDGTTLVNMKKVIETGASLHGAVTQRGCVECHEIHGGGHRRLLTNEYPSDLYYPFTENTYALCFGCHDKQMVLQAKSANVTSFRNGENNLHFVHVNSDKKGRSCKVCHDAHAASRDKHIRETVSYGAAGWKLPIKYEALAEGGRCGAGCHAPYEYNRVTPVVNNTSAPAPKWNGEDLVPGSRATPKETTPDQPRK